MPSRKIGLVSSLPLVLFPRGCATVGTAKFNRLHKSTPISRADWLMGAISSNPAQLARLVGIYKGVQSAGAASAFAMDSGGTSYMNELAATWAVGVAGLVFAAPVVAFRLRKGACGVALRPPSRAADVAFTEMGAACAHFTSFSRNGGGERSGGRGHQHEARLGQCLERRQEGRRWRRVKGGAWARVESHRHSVTVVFSDSPRPFCTRKAVYEPDSVSLSLSLSLCHHGFTETVCVQ